MKESLLCPRSVLTAVVWGTAAGIAVLGLWGWLWLQTQRSSDSVYSIAAVALGSSYSINLEAARSHLFLAEYRQIIQMNEQLTQKVRNDFDRIALCEPEGWNHNNHYHRFLLKQLPVDCGTALEIGCGTGEFSRLLAQRCQQVIALDLSPNMIEVAKQRSSQYSNLEFQVADVLQWQAPAEQFDAIVSIATLHHLPVEHLLSTLKTALKPGGRLIILDLVALEHLFDQASDLIAVPLNWLFQQFKNRSVQPSAEAGAALAEHLRTDQYLTLTQARRIYTHALQGARVRKHLFWRYSAIWQKPVTDCTQK